jgi:hypothetical protein
MKKAPSKKTPSDSITVTLARDEAAFLRRLLGSVRAMGTEMDTKVLRNYFFSPYDDWLEHIDQKLEQALIANHNDSSEE